MIANLVTEGPWWQRIIWFVLLVVVVIGLGSLCTTPRQRKRRL